LSSTLPETEVWIYTCLTRQCVHG